MIYADNAATTRLSATALAAMLPYLTEQYGNPSSLYTLGQTAATALAQAQGDRGPLSPLPPGRDCLYLRRQRSGQPSHPLRRPLGKTAGENPYHLHRL